MPTNRKAQPTTTSLSPERLAIALGLLKSVIDQDAVPGAATGIFHRGEPVKLAGFGLRGPSPEDLAVEADTIFLIASLTKPIVCAGAMLLLQDGAISLDDTVADYVPAFAAHGKAAITLRHVMTHTSGLPDQLPQSPELRREQAPVAEFVAAVNDFTPLFPAGTRVSYQSMGILMLAQVIERVTGRRVRDFLRERLFLPLGMHDSTLGMPEGGLTRAAMSLPASFGPDSPDVGSDWNSAYWRDFGAPWGGLHSTVGDLGRFLMHVLGDLPGPLSLAARQAMTRDQLPPEAIAGEPLCHRWGLGFMLDAAYFGDLTSPRTFGHVGSTGSLYWADPETHLACVLLTNQPRVLRNPHRGATSTSSSGTRTPWLRRWRGDLPPPAHSPRARAARRPSPREGVCRVPAPLPLREGRLEGGWGVRSPWRIIARGGVAMQEQTYIRDIAAHVGEEVTLKGWLYNRTDKGRLQFLLCATAAASSRPSSSRRASRPEAFEAAAHLTQESSLIVSGTVRADERAPGGFELDVSDLQVVQLAQEYPIPPKEHGVDFLMDRRHLWMRSPHQAAILRVRADVIRAIREWLDAHGFINVDTPILTPSACEGTTTLFDIDYFETAAYLTQSGQLYNEANVMAFGKVYCFGPTFRAEKSKTRRHLTEFWMVEPEMAYVDLDDDMEVRSSSSPTSCRARCSNCAARAEGAGARHGRRWRRSMPPFPRMQYDEAVRAAQREGRAHRVGRRLRRAARDGHRRALRQAGVRAPLPDRDQGLLHGARPGAPRAVAVGGPDRPRGLRRDHRRRPAHPRPGAAGAAPRRSTSCRARPTSGTSTCAATARCRTPASAWASSAPSPGCAACSTSARRSPSRARWAASGRRHGARRSNGAAVAGTGAPHRLLSASLSASSCLGRTLAEEADAWSDLDVLVIAGEVASTRGEAARIDRSLADVRRARRCGGGAQFVCRASPRHDRHSSTAGAA